MRCVFDEADLLLLSELYSKLDCREEAYDIGKMSTIFKKYLSINIVGKRYSASNINQHHPCICMARWNEAVFGRMPDVDATISTVSYDPYVRPVIIEYVAGHRVSSKSQPGQTYDEKIVIRVNWLRSFQDCFLFGKPLQCWCCDDFVIQYG